jgi:hypothetical protein
MKHFIVSIFVGCVISMSAAARIADAAQRSPSPAVLPIFVDHATAPPKQLDQLLATADAAVLVRIENMKFEARVNPAVGRADDVTKYDLRVVAVFKPHPMLSPSGGMLTITRKGGQHTENGTVVRSAVVGFEDFQPNETYVLFLSWNNRTSEFDVHFGPEGSYHLLSSGTVKALGRSDVAKAQDGKRQDVFLGELRAAVGR